MKIQQQINANNIIVEFIGTIDRQRLVRCLSALEKETIAHIICDFHEAQDLCDQSKSCIDEFAKRASQQQKRVEIKGIQDEIDPRAVTELCPHNTTVQAEPQNNIPATIVMSNDENATQGMVTEIPFSQEEWQQMRGKMRFLIKKVHELEQKLAQIG